VLFSGAEVLPSCDCDGWKDEGGGGGCMRASTGAPQAYLPCRAEAAAVQLRASEAAAASAVLRHAAWC
jgi:hypothetical protein